MPYQYPSILAGTPLTASVFAAIETDYVFKSANATPRTNNTPVADPDLQFTVVSGGVYLAEFNLQYAGIAAAGFSTTWFVPSPGTGNRSVLGPASNAAQSNADAISMKCSVFSMGAACIYGCARNNVGAFQFAYESCLFTAVANGSLILNWAQASTNATGTILGANSWGRMVQLA